MPAEAKVSGRLITALEDLVAQEAASLQAGDYDTLLQLQQRADPLIARLGELESEADAEARARIAGWLARRQENARLLAQRIASTRTAMEQIDASRRRVARVGPAYLQAAESARRLCAVG